MEDFGFTTEVWFFLIALVAVALFFFKYLPARGRTKGNPKFRNLAPDDLRPDAEQGDAGAQCTLGLMYYEGHEQQGVLQDYTEAAKWLHKAAEQGVVEAQRTLASMYEQGQGVTQNDDEMYKWYRKAAAQGDIHAKDILELLELERSMEGK